MKSDIYLTMPYFKFHIQQVCDIKTSFFFSSIHNENEQALQQQQLKTSYAQLPSAHVALFAIPPTDNSLVQSTKEPIK